MLSCNSFWDESEVVELRNQQVGLRLYSGVLVVVFMPTHLQVSFTRTCPCLSMLWTLVGDSRITRVLHLW